MDSDEVFRRFELLQRVRGVWESHWEEIAERVLPRSTEFVGEREAGSKRTQKLFDATAALALERFAAAVESLLTPRGARWHTLRSTNPELNKDDDVRQWFDDVENAMFAYRYSPKANFSGQVHEGYMSLGAFGTGCTFVDEDPVRGAIYRACHLSDIFIAEDEHGRIDTVFRRFEVTARQALRMFEDGDLSDDLRKQGQDKPDDKIKLLHDRDTEVFRGMAFVDFTHTEATDKAMKKSGQNVKGKEIYVKFSVPRQKGKGKGASGRPNGIKSKNTSHAPPQGGAKPPAGGGATAA